jgi:DNA-binding winged helix-turn-helix (wHTH) protein
MGKGRIRFESFELDLETAELQRQSQVIPLQDKPARLLTLLASRPGELVTRSEIQKTLWDDGEFVEFDHAVNVAIHKIRAALEDNPENPRIIQTLPRKGYRFIAAVDIVAKPSTVTLPEVTQDSSAREKLRDHGGDDDFVLPVTVDRARHLFLLAQVPYVATYLAAFYYLDDLDGALARTLPFIPVSWSVPAFLLLALLGFAVRVYLIPLVGWGHTQAGPRYRKLFPFLLPLDALWAVTPVLARPVGPLLSLAGMILMTWLIFGQRTLMRTIERAPAP